MTAKTLPTLLAVLLLAATGLAGCITDESSDLSTDDGDSTADTSGNETFAGGNETTSDGSTSGAPSVAIDVTGDDVAVNDTENGTVYEIAVGANITFDASASTDPAGGNLTFSWELGDGNTTDAENVTYAYDAAGNYTVTVTVTSDASGESSSESLTVAAVAADAAGASEQTLEAETTLSCPQCWYVGRDASVTWNTGDEGIDMVSIEIPPEYAGTGFELTSTGDPDVWFFDACDGSELDYHDNEGDEAGEIPAGATCAWMYDFNADGSTLSLTIGLPL